LFAIIIIIIIIIIINGIYRAQDRPGATNTIVMYKSMPSNSLYYYNIKYYGTLAEKPA